MAAMDVNSFSDGSNGSVPKDDRRLAGKVAIITGGASGIGEAAVTLFAACGASVIIADVQDENGKELASQLGPSVIYQHCDVRKEADVCATVDLAVTRFGQLDILYNNAGVLGKNTELQTLEMDDFDNVMSINVRGMALGIKHAARVMIPNKKGVILCTSSLASVMAGMSPHGYTVSKHAILGLSKTAASELGKHGIRVNCVSPFGVATPMLVNFIRENANDPSLGTEAVESIRDQHANLKGRNLTAMDVAKAALFLASDDAGYISGLNMIVDGGFGITNHCFDA